MIDHQVDTYLADFLDKDYGAATFAKGAGGGWASNSIRAISAASTINPPLARAKDEAARQAEGQILDAIEENVPEDAEQDEWNWEALAKFVNTRWQLNLRDRDLKKIGRESLAETLIEKAREAIEQTDLSQVQRLEEGFGLRTACGWVAVQVRTANRSRRAQRARSPRRDRAGARAGPRRLRGKRGRIPRPRRLSHFTARDAQGQKRYDRDQLVAWARQRFDVDLNVDDLRNMQREDVQRMLVEYSKKTLVQADQTLAEAHQQVVKLFGEGANSQATVRMVTGGNGALSSLTDWLRERMAVEIPPEAIADLDRDELERKLAGGGRGSLSPRNSPSRARRRPLCARHHVEGPLAGHGPPPSSVGLRGYAQVDPKVEYKREGMRTFEQMWSSLGERVTDMIFRMEEQDEGFVGSTWTDSRATHDSPPAGTATLGADQQTAIDNSDTPPKQEPIRNRGQRVGRNDPCPCGSGKKFKNCHMRPGGMT